MKSAAVGLGVVLGFFSFPALADEDESCPTATSSDRTDEEKEAAKDKTSCSRCSCRTKCGCKKPKVELTITGIRPSITRVATAGSAPTTDIGVAFAGAVDTYALDGSAHGQMQWVLGGGQAGFEGMLGGVIEGGYRIDVTEKQGPFGRAGFDGRMQGNDRVYFSALELPRLTFGYQFLSDRTVLEVGTRGGPILTGRFNPGDSGVRSISGSLEYGAFASAQFDFLRIEANAMRIDARKTGDRTPVDVGRATLCGIGAKFGICADFSVFRGTANMGAGPGQGVQDAVATYAGVTFGLATW